MSKEISFLHRHLSQQADQIVDQPKNRNFSNNRTSPCCSDKGTTRDFAHEKSNESARGSCRPAPARGGRHLGGALGMDRRELAPWPFLESAPSSPPGTNSGRFERPLLSAAAVGGIAGGFNRSGHS
jgi:hypothetical protein